MLLAATNLKLTAAEIFAATTYNAAAAVNSQEYLGFLGSGGFADVLLWRYEPSSGAERFLQRIVLEQIAPSKVFASGRRSED